MTLIYFDGFDDRQNVMDGLYETGDATYTGWGLTTYIYDGEDDGSYLGARQVSRYDSIGYSLAATDIDSWYEYHNVELHASDGNTYNYWHFGFATSDGSLGNRVALYNGTSYQVFVSVDPTGDITLDGRDSGGTFCAAYSNQGHQSMMGGGAVYEIYIGAGLGAGNDFAKIWVNGELVIDATGLTLTYSVGTPCDKAYIPYYTGTVDDIWCYASNSPISAPIGEHRVLSMKPIGAGNNSDFTPLAGNNYENVDEYNQDFDTSYNSSDGTSGHRDDFEMSNLSDQVGINSTVKALTVRAMVTASASEQVRPYVEVGGTRYYGDAFSPPSTSYMYAEHIWEVNPATSNPWTVSEIDAVKAGYEVV